MLRVIRNATENYTTHSYILRP